MGEIEIQIMHLRGKIAKNTERLQEILILMSATVKDFSTRIKTLEADAKRQNIMVEELTKFVEHLQENACKNEK